MNNTLSVALRDAYLCFLNGNIHNIRIGDFLYRHNEANPKWYTFFDPNGNMVSHGGRGDQTDVVVRIQGEDLKARLDAYLCELVARHGEVLHMEGSKKFYAVTIILPLSVFRQGSNTEVTIHTGSGGCYDQDEIAYEVMAALSGLLVYKALAPMFSHYDFVREDKVDDGQWVSYLFEEHGIRLTFSPLDDQTSVTVIQDSSRSQDKRDTFVATMYDILKDWLSVFSSSRMVCESGLRSYARNLANDQGVVRVNIAQDNNSERFAIQIPFRSHLDFGRIKYAEDVMENLTRVFSDLKESKSA